MYLRRLVSAFPEHVYSQAQVWEALQCAPQVKALGKRGKGLLKKVLLSSEAGIERRHFALPELAPVFERDAQELNAFYEREVRKLGGEALRKLLEQSGLRAEELDGLWICSCTGYLCPGPSSYLAEEIGMREDAVLHDVVGLGCGAAIPTLRAVQDYLDAEKARGNAKKVAMLAIELSSAAFHVEEDDGVLVSLCLFGDGASASLWSSDPEKWCGDSGESGEEFFLKCEHFSSVHQPEHREKIRLVNREGRLCNQLERSVPELAARAVKGLWENWGGESRPEVVLTHTGGREVLDQLEGVLQMELPDARQVLKNYGNVSSPCVLLALEHYLESGRWKSEVENLDELRLWLAAFGAGFSAHACEIRLIR